MAPLSGPFDITEARNAEDRHSLPLTISADANAKHQHVVTAMDVAGRLGFTQISIATVNDPVE